jgi:pimeloyl-ACP methyl ester carboxylesterase
VLTDSSYSHRIVSCILGCTYASSKTCERNPELVKFQSQSLPPSPAATADSNDDAFKQQQLLFITYFLTPSFVGDKENESLIHELHVNSKKYNRTIKGGRGQGAAVATHDLETQLKNVTVPTLIQHGTADATVMFSNGLRLHELLSNSKLSVFENAGHGYWHFDWKEGRNGRIIREVNEWFLQHDKHNPSDKTSAAATKQNEVN